jgi:hypothetical protein
MQLSDFDRTRPIASTILAILISDSIAISPGQTGQIECYENRTYRVAPTRARLSLGLSADIR